MVEVIAVSIIHVSIGLLVLLIGFLIRNKGMTSLIAGYDPSQVRDEEGLARWVGTGVMEIGAVEVLAGGLMALLPGYALILVLAFVAVAIGGMVTLVVGSRRFMKK